ncbi:MAG: TadE/TadG family type IV pilus assembly protein [bacterium]
MIKINGFNNEKGSFLVMGIFFLVIFMMVAGLAVDISRYLVKRQKLRRVADGAALAGAGALKQYTDDSPAIEPAYESVLDYLEAHFGTEYLELYEKHSDTDVVGITVQKYGDGSTDKPQYRVGVVVYGGFAPYFFPDRFLGEDFFAFYELAVAETYYEPRTRVEYKPINCGMVANGSIELTGNNFNTDIDGEPATICTNADIDASRSSEGVLGDIYTAGDFQPPGGSHGEVHTDEPVREKPDFEYDYPEHPGYDVVINDTNFYNWPTCDGDNSVRRLTTKDGQQLDSCVTRAAAEDYVFDSPVDLSKSSLSTGDSIGIYSEGSLTFTANDNYVSGGIYSTGNITVEKNTNEFLGNPDKLGGLALWAEGDADVQMNNVRLRGIVGAEGDYDFTGPPGGGDISGFRGMLVSGGGFSSADNSEYTRFQYDSEYIDYDALDMNDWTEAVHREVDEPYYSQISTRLVY